MTSWDKYAGSAGDWSETQYADARAYLAHRAELIRSLGPPLEAGDTLLDLACGDGGLADFLPDVRYLGVDASDEMIAAGRARGRTLELADLNDYVPSQPVQVTTIFRAVYYARSRPAFFKRVRGYTERKLVFDLNPRQYELRDVQDDLRVAGFTRLDTQPFFVPQTRAIPFLTSLERTGALARLLLRYRFTLLCAASF